MSDVMKPGRLVFPGECDGEELDLITYNMETWQIVDQAGTPVNISEIRRFLTYDPATFQLKDKNGNPAEIPEKFKDREYEFRFDFGKINFSNGEEVHCTGDISGTGTIGYIFEERMVNFKPKLVSQGTKRSHDFFDSFGFYTDDEAGKERFKKIDEGPSALFYTIASTISGWKYADQDALQVQIDFLNCTKMYSELLENATSSAERFLQCDKMAATICEIMEGTLHPEDVKDYFGSALFKSCCKATLALRRRYIGITGDEKDAADFFEAFNDYLPMQTIQELGFKPSALNEMKTLTDFSYRLIKNYSVLADCLVETFLLMSGLRLSLHIRQTPQFRTTRHLICGYTGLLYDIVAIKNGMDLTEHSNLITVAGRDMPLEEAFTETLNSIKDVANDFTYMRAMSEQMYPHVSEYPQYQNCCESYILTYYLWFSSTAKAGKGIVFDFIVKEQNDDEYEDIAKEDDV